MIFAYFKAKRADRAKRKRLEGVNRIRRNMTAQYDMLIDAARPIEFHDLVRHFALILEAHPQATDADLEWLSNKLGRQGHMLAREAV